MTKYLWTGESEYCICGYHVTDHETLQWPISLTERHVVICRGDNKVYHCLDAANHSNLYIVPIWLHRSKAANTFH
jgi:hypothetical protein